MLGLGGTALMDRAEFPAYVVLAANSAFDGKLIQVPGGVFAKWPDFTFVLGEFYRPLPELHLEYHRRQNYLCSINDTVQETKHL